MWVSGKRLLPVLFLFVLQKKKYFNIFLKALKNGLMQWAEVIVQPELCSVTGTLLNSHHERCLLQEDPSQAFVRHTMMPLQDVEQTLLVLLLLLLPVVQETAASWRSTLWSWSSCWTWKSATVSSPCGVSSLGPPCLCCTAKVCRYQSMRLRLQNYMSTTALGDGQRNDSKISKEIVKFWKRTRQPNQHLTFIRWNVMKNDADTVSVDSEGVRQSFWPHVALRSSVVTCNMSFTVCGCGVGQSCQRLYAVPHITSSSVPRWNGARWF